MSKKQQIEEMTRKIETLDAQSAALAAENAALTNRLMAAEETIRLQQTQLTNNKEAVLSQKSVAKARELLAAAIDRSKQIQAEAEASALNARKQAEDLLLLAKAEAAALRAAAVEDTARGKAQWHSRILDTLSALAQQNNVFTADIRRQSLMLTAAVQETADRLLSTDGGPESCDAILADRLAEAFRLAAWEDAPRERELSGTIVIKSLEEFEALGSYGFRNSVLLTRVVLPEGVTALPESFFYGCTSLIQVTLPKSLAAIGDYAFFGCARLQNITLPKEIEHIGAYAFSGCIRLSALRIPSGVKSIGVAAFRNCDALSSLTISPGGCLTEIGSHAFQNCGKLKGCMLPKELECLSTSLFFGCESIEELDVPAAVKQMEADAFYGCKSLRRVSFHNGKLLLMPGSMEGLAQAELTLAGQPFSCQSITEPTLLEDVFAETDGRNAASTQKQGESRTDEDVV